MSKLLDPKSTIATRSELDLFTLPMTQIGVEKTSWTEIQLRNTLSNDGDGPIEFQLSPIPHMLQLSKNYVLFEARIVDEIGDPLNKNKTSASKDLIRVGPINLLGKTFFKQVKLQLNGTEVFDSGSDYAYRAYLETELQYGIDAKNSFLQASGYASDDLDKNNSVDSVDNSGFTERSEQFLYGAWCQLAAPLHVDLFQQNKFLLSGMDVRLILYRNSDAFCLLNFTDADVYKIELRNIKLLVQTVETLKAVTLSIERTLQDHSAKYPLRRVESRTIHISAGRLQSPENALFNGVIPRRVLVGLVAADAYHGHPGKSPFFFENFGISEILINAGGTIYPSRRAALSYKNNQYTGAFINLFENLGLAGEDLGNNIGLKEYKNGWNLYAFNLSTTGDDDGNWAVPKTGTTSFEINFDKTTPKAIVCIVIAEFDGLLTIDHYRNCFLDHRSL